MKRGRPQDCSLRARSGSDSVLDARVPAVLDSIEQRFDIWFPVAVINLAGRAEVSTEELRRYNQIGAVAADVAVERFFDTDSAVTRLDIDLAQN